MSTIREALADNLLRILNETGMSQAELARKLKLSFPTINTIANPKNKGGPTWNTISKLAKALDVEETDLVAVTPKPGEMVQDIKQGLKELERSITQLKTNTQQNELIPASILKKISKLDEKKRAILFKMFEVQLDRMEKEDEKDEAESG